MPLWWRRYDTCHHMGWTVQEYDQTPVARLVEVEYAIAMERRHQAAHNGGAAGA